MASPEKSSEGDPRSEESLLLFYKSQLDKKDAEIAEYLERWEAYREGCQ